MAATIHGGAADYRRVLVTGAAGYLGSVLRAGLRGRYPALRLTDVAPLAHAPSADEEYVRCDLANPADVAAAMRGVDAVVHLGAQSVEADWETILHANIVGTWNVFEAARREGVRRVVYASSHHVMGYYRREQRVGVEEPPRPDSRYAISKVFGEAVGRMYADKHGMSVVAQRIGVARVRPEIPRHLRTWISERDYVQLTQRCLDARDVHFLVVYGVSANDGAFWNNPGADALGFVPLDNGAAFADGVHAKQRPEDEPAVERLFQGGWFCGMEFDGDVGDID
jgi:uronate dehydrogenase